MTKNPEMPKDINVEAVMMGLHAKRRISLDKAIERFIEDKQLTGLQKVTIDNYRQQARVFQTFCKARNLSVEDLRSVRNYHIKEYQKYLLNEKETAPATVNTYCKTMKLIFDAMQKNGLTDSNPFRDVPKIKVGKQPVGYTPNKDELQKCINYQVKKAQGNYIQYRNLILLVFLADTGARVNECINVKRQHLQLSERGREYVVLHHTKNGTPRKIGLSNRLVNLLNQYLPLIENMESEYLFISQRLKQISKREVQHIISIIGDAVNLPELSCHALRRHFASVKISNKIPLLSLMKLMGHSQPQITLRYYSEFDDDFLDYSNLGIE